MAFSLAALRASGSSRTTAACSPRAGRGSPHQLPLNNQFDRAIGAGDLPRHLHRSLLLTKRLACR